MVPIEIMYEFEQHDETNPGEILLLLKACTASAGVPPGVHEIKNKSANNTSCQRFWIAFLQSNLVKSS